MHSGQHIKQANHQVPIDLSKFTEGGKASFTISGKPVGQNLAQLNVTEVNVAKGYLVAAGTKFQAYMGSLQSHNGQLGVLEAA